ncbi:hypothetical protein ABIC63_002904 [Pseudacidovorax sp. 1753]|uniref:hypothetical protein n=1 Tax=Pseudacidovorax sp. 1753 TaxID=3156419 RepID=UPI00339A9354
MTLRQEFGGIAPHEFKWNLAQRTLPAGKNLPLTQGTPESIRQVNEDNEGAGKFAEELADTLWEDFVHAYTRIEALEEFRPAV